MGGRERKEAGLDTVSENNNVWVEMLREVAIEVSMRQGVVFIDDLRRWADSEGLTPEQFCPRCKNGDCTRVHRNAWGAVFRGKNWVWTGEYRKSLYASNHHHESKVWAYVGDGPVYAPSAPPAAPPPAAPPPAERWRKRKWGT